MGLSVLSSRQEPSESLARLCSYQTSQSHRLSCWKHWIRLSGFGYFLKTVTLQSTTVEWPLPPSPFCFCGLLLSRHAVEERRKLETFWRCYSRPLMVRWVGFKPKWRGCDFDYQHIQVHTRKSTLHMRRTH